jgi:altronate dehydratase
LLADRRFSSALLGAVPPHATLAYGQPLATPGFHIVASETDHWVENLTGLGACGAHLALTVVHQHARQGHPLLPVIQVAESAQRGVIPADDIDLFLTDRADDNSAALAQLLVAIAQRDRLPAVTSSGSVDFQFTRGLLGVTT